MSKAKDHKSEAAQNVARYVKALRDDGCDVKSLIFGVAYGLGVGRHESIDTASELLGLLEQENLRIAQDELEHAEWLDAKYTEITGGKDA